MNVDTLQIPALITIILALTSLVILPVTSMAMSRTPAKAEIKGSDSSDGSACDLPPSLELETTADKNQSDGQPFMDTRAAEKFKTATFAMG